MNINKWFQMGIFMLMAVAICLFSSLVAAVNAGDLDEVIKTGRLRHLGIQYANFVTKEKTGLDVELMQQFAAHLGAAYELVETNWQDILPDLTGKKVKPLLKNRSVLGLKDSCLDTDLYGMNETGAEVKQFAADRNLEEMIAAVIARMTDTTLMDVPVALVALEQWPGEIKVIGPVSPQQDMACAFPKSSPNLRQAFNEFFRQSKANGKYQKLVAKYYPSVFTCYPEFFKK
jgi:ABC-type amino acid transport substrate-binding protein